MTYYVTVKPKLSFSGFIFINTFNSEEEAKAAALDESNRNDLSYVEYGIVNYDGWEGDLTIAVIKNEE